MNENSSEKNNLERVILNGEIIKKYEILSILVPGHDLLKCIKKFYRDDVTQDLRIVYDAFLLSQRYPNDNDNELQQHYLRDINNQIRFYHESQNNTQKSQVSQSSQTPPKYTEKEDLFCKRDSRTEEENSLFRPYPPNHS